MIRERDIFSSHVFGCTVGSYSGPKGTRGASWRMCDWEKMMHGGTDGWEEGRTLSSTLPSADSSSSSFVL